MKNNINPEKFALHVISSTPAKSDSPEAIASEKLELYLASYKEAEMFNETVVKANKQAEHTKFFEKV